MTVQILLGDKIRSELLKILAGMSFEQRDKENPCLYILSPWISDVPIEFSDLKSLDEWDELFLVGDYGIKSINLPYALLLVKIHRGAEVNIIARPPTEEHYFHNPQYASRVKILYDFLDEIGCNIFVNPDLHAKLIFSNDLALLGSFNLTKAALCDKEEIGVSINDLDNLSLLEDHSKGIVFRSQLYGYSSPLNWGWFFDSKEEVPDEVRIERQKKRKDKITRGWLFEYMMKTLHHPSYHRYMYGDFFNVTSREDKDIKSYCSNLNLFYLTNFRRLLSEKPDWMKSIDFKDFFDYEGEESMDSCLEFINEKFARKNIPSIRLRIKSFE